MRVWLIAVGEPLPIDGGGDRLLRTGILAELMAAQGHEVVWWTSTFDHARKAPRFDEDTAVDAPAGYRIQLLHSIRYPRNVSVRRIFNHHGVARRFSRLSQRERRPHVILCSLPTIELCLAAERYGRRSAVPVALDVRDLWPDDIAGLAPAPLRPLAHLALWPMYRDLGRACAGASAICATSSVFVDWGLRHGGRARTPLDRDFPLGYRRRPPSAEAQDKALDFWADLGITPDHGKFLACFFGALGHNSEIEAVIGAARRLKSAEHEFLFVLCGTGDRLERYRGLSSDLDNFVLPGWVGAAEIWTLMRMASVGLAPFQSIFSYMSNYPNKSIEYLSAGLPIVSSLKGMLKDLLADRHCGVTYENRDADELARLLLELDSQRERLATMASNAGAVFDELFAAERVYGDMSDHLSTIASHGHAVC